MTARHAIAGLLLLALAPAAAGAAAPEWTVEEGSRVGFVAGQGGAPVEGRFERFEAAIAFDPEAPETGRVEVVIDVASVNSDSRERDDTIRGANLFDVATWPTARFAADRFDAVGEGAFEAHGTLTLRDVTRAVVLPFTLEIVDHPDDPGSLRAHAVGSLDVRRLDYGVGQGVWRDTTAVADEVTITIDILARRPK
jgi:polyisoprenoid-binding protein YceI